MAEQRRGNKKSAADVDPRHMEQLHEALMRAGPRWTTLSQLGLDKSITKRKVIGALLASKRAVDVGSCGRQHFYAGVLSETPEATLLDLAIQAATQLAQNGKLTLLPLSESQKEVAYKKLPSKLRGKVIVLALQQLAKHNQAFLVKIRGMKYAALSAHLRALLDETGDATQVKPQPFAPAIIERHRVLNAYQRLSRQRKSPNIAIAELWQETGLPLEPLKAWLLAECRAHRAVPYLGEPSQASSEQLQAALTIDGRPHIYVCFAEGGS